MEFNSFPPWLDEIFLKFAILYEGQWTYALKEDGHLLGKKILWYDCLNGFNPKAIYSALRLSGGYFAKPPSLAEFKELVQSESRRIKFDQPQLSHKDSGRGELKPGDLLYDYMLKNPPKADDPFKKIFAETKQGKERGIAVIREIKRQLGVKTGKRNLCEQKPKSSTNS